MVMRDILSGQAPARTETFEGRTPAPTPLGLTLAERAELEWVFCGYEADIGIRSTFREMVDVVGESRDAEETNGPIPCGRSVGGVPADYHDRLLGLHFAKHRPLERAGQIYRALKATPGLHVTVLWLLHGPPRPSALHPVFGDVASIVHLTSTVEDAREQMAFDESEVRDVRADVATAEAFDDHREALVRDFWDAAGKSLAFARRVDDLRSSGVLTEGAAAKCADLEERAAAWRVVMGRIIAAYHDAQTREPQGRLRARLTAMASADHELTPQAAIRWRLDYHGPRGKDGKPNPDAMKAHAEARRLFIVKARLEAERMRIAAANAYRNALRAVRA